MLNVSSICSQPVKPPVAELKPAFKGNINSFYEYKKTIEDCETEYLSKWMPGADHPTTTEGKIAQLTEFRTKLAEANAYLAGDGSKYLNTNPTARSMFLNTEGWIQGTTRNIIDLKG